MQKTMLSSRLVFIVLACLHTICSCSQDSHQNNSEIILGVFVASTPCGEGKTRPLPGMDLKMDCEFMKWRLTLFEDKKNHTPSSYKIRCVYGMSKPNTTGFINGGTTLELNGKWKIIKGSRQNPGAIIYQLNPDQPSQSVYLLRLDENLLHLLDSEKELMIGNGGWSYTLNKTNL